MGVSISSSLFKKNDTGEWCKIYEEDFFRSDLKDWSAVLTGEYNYSLVDQITTIGIPPEVRKYFDDDYFTFGEYSFGWAWVDELLKLQYDSIIVRDIRQVPDWRDKKSRYGFEQVIALAPKITLLEFLGQEFVDAVLKCKKAGGELIVFYSN